MSIPWHEPGRRQDRTVGLAAAVIASVAGLWLAVCLGLIVAQAMIRLVLPIPAITAVILALFTGSTVCLLAGGIAALARRIVGGVLLIVGAALALSAFALEWRLSPELDRVAGYLDLVFGPGEQVALPTYLVWHLRAVGIVVAPVVLVLAALPSTFGYLMRRTPPTRRPTPTRFLGGLTVVLGLLQAIGCLNFGFRDVRGRVAQRSRLFEMNPTLIPDGLDPVWFYPVLAVVTLCALGTGTAGVLGVRARVGRWVGLLALGAGVVGCAAAAIVLVMASLSLVPVFHAVPPSVFFALGVLQLGVGIAAFRGGPFEGRTQHMPGPSATVPVRRQPSSSWNAPPGPPR